MSLAAKTAQPDITHTLFKEQPINVPPHDFQRRATARIEELDALASSLESKCRLKLAALDALKASLLHHAFTGQLTGRPSVAVAAISAR